MIKEDLFDEKSKSKKLGYYIVIFLVSSLIIIFLSFAVSGELFSSDESVNSDPEMMYINSSLNHYRNENYSQAYNEVSQALNINKSNYISLTLMASVLLKTGDYAGCIEYSEKAMEVDGHSSDPFLLKEISLLRLGFKERGISYISGNSGEKKYSAGDIITVNTCESDSENYYFWNKWNRLNLWESPGSEKYIGTTNARDNVEIIIIEEREYNGDIYYKIKEVNRDLSGWL